jgi:hypothetical protein
MPPPAENQCHFPVKKNGRTVFCGKETMLIDPNTGSYLMWCSDHHKDLLKALGKIQSGHKDYPRGKIVAGTIHINK